MAIVTAVHALRQRFAALSKARVTALDQLANEIPLSTATLYKFRGGGTVSLDALYAIETWCDAQERRRTP